MSEINLDKNGDIKHVAIIMDGNGRWACERGVERFIGHKHGVKAVRSVVEGAIDIGLEYLTLYVFSIENWSRPKEETDALMALFIRVMVEEINKLNKQNVKVIMVGREDLLPDGVYEKLRKVVDKTTGNTGLNLILALSYSGRWEILEAVKKMVQDSEDKSFDIQDIDEPFFERYMSTAGVPDPELLIRTSSEYRLSNFLLWQIAYTELYFSPKLWPDFRKEDLFEAIEDFRCRERRFGGIGG